MACCAVIIDSLSVRLILARNGIGCMGVQIPPIQLGTTGKYVDIV